MEGRRRGGPLTDCALPSAESTPPICARGKTEDRKVDGYKFGEAPLPRHWCGNNRHRDAKQQRRPNPDRGSDRESAFAAICWLSSARRKNNHPRRTPLLSFLIQLAETSSKFSVDERSRPNGFADAVSEHIRFALKRYVRRDELVRSWFATHLVNASACTSSSALAAPRAGAAPCGLENVTGAPCILMEAEAASRILIISSP
jgi:hypothetical protein